MTKINAINILYSCVESN